MTKQKLIDAEEEKRRLEEESAQVRGAPLPHAPRVSRMAVGSFAAASRGCQRTQGTAPLSFSPEAFLICWVKHNGS